MTKHTSNFRGKINRDAQKQKNADSSHGYLNLPKNVKSYSAESEIRKIQIDILPYIVSDPNHPNKDIQNDIAVKGGLWYRRPFKIHRNVGSDTNTSTVICPTSVGKKCPICDYQKKRFAEGAPKDETKELYPKPRNLYVVIPIGQKDFDEVPHIWDMAQSLFQDVLVETLEEDDSNEVFPDLEEGKTLELSLKWKSISDGKPFPEVRNIKFLDREPYDEKILNEMPDLDKCLNVLSYEELSNKFFEIESEEVGGKLTEIVDAPPTRKRRSVRTEEPEERIPAKEAEEPRKSFRRSRDTEEGEQTRKTPEPEVSVPSRRKPVREEPEEPVPTRVRREREPATKDRCPYGHKFGIDTEKFDDCDKCEIWADCIDVKEGK